MLLKFLMFVSLGLNFYQYWARDNRPMAKDSGIYTPLPEQECAERPVKIVLPRRLINTPPAKSKTPDLDISFTDHSTPEKEKKSSQNTEAISYQHFLENWDEKINSLFVNDLGLDENYFNDYQKIREEYNNNLEAILKKYNPGENQIWLPGISEQKERIQVKEYYLAMLKKEIGFQAFTAYQKLIHEHNQRSLKRTPTYYIISF